MEKTKKISSYRKQALKQLKAWFLELGPFYADWDDVVGVVPVEKEHMIEEGYVTIHLYSKTHVYRISAICKPGHSYLGCVLDVRLPYPGCKYGGGADLPDGKFDKKTWDDIIRAIVAFELLPVYKDKMYEVPITKEEPKGPRKSINLRKGK